MSNKGFTISYSTIDIALVEKAGCGWSETITMFLL